MRKSYEETAYRRRAIRWKVSTDEIAKNMARERFDGNVSALLELLVLQEFSKGGTEPDSKEAA